MTEYYGLNDADVLIYFAAAEETPGQAPADWSTGESIAAVVTRGSIKDSDSSTEVFTAGQRTMRGEIKGRLSTKWDFSGLHTTDEFGQVGSTHKLRNLASDGELFAMQIQIGDAPDDTITITDCRCNESDVLLEDQNGITISCNGYGRKA